MSAFKNLCQQRGVNRYDLAKATKINLNQIRSWEMGIGLPDFMEIVALHKTLNISFQAIFELFKENYDKKKNHPMYFSGFNNSF